MGQSARRKKRPQKTATAIHAQHLAWLELTAQEARSNWQRHHDQLPSQGRQTSY